MRQALVLAALTLVAAIAFAQGPSPSTTPTPSLKFDPRLAPAYIELLKKQATDRKNYFAEQARQRSEFAEKMRHGREALLTEHRSSRKAFGDAQHTRAERAAFFKNQRAEMVTLEQSQKEAEKSFEERLTVELGRFHQRQHQEREELGLRLVRAHH